MNAVALGSTGRSSRRSTRLPSTLAVGTIAMASAWTQATAQTMTGDYAKDYEPALNALLGGRLAAFFHTLPTNGAGGSLLLRAPFALIAKLAGGDQLAIFRAGTFACMLALGVLGLLLLADLDRQRAPLLTRVGALAMCLAAPILLQAVFYGHPEEALGAALAVAAVLLSGADRPATAGVLIGLAIVNKPWGVFAIGPVLLCSPDRRLRVLISSGAVVGAWLLPFALIAPSHLWLSAKGAGTFAFVAHPQSLWWPFAHTAGLYSRPPALAEAHARQLAVALAAIAAVALWARRRRIGPAIDTNSCLALLAFGFALRCLLEPATHIYYQLPLVIALVAWEARARRSAAISLAVTILLVLDFGRLEEASTTASFLLYLAILLPACAVLAVRALRTDSAQPG